MAFGALGGTLLGGGLGALFGESVDPLAQRVQNRPAATINAGGLTSSFNTLTNQFTVGSNARRQGLVSDRASLFGQQGREYGGLVGQVTPGFGRLTQARVQAVQNARRRSLGDLRENLARRRIGGSSFAADAVTRAEAEFAQQEAEVRAQSFLEELQLKSDLLDRQFTAARGEFETYLNELNLQTEVALKLSQGANAVLSANEQFAAELMAREVASDNAFYGQVGGAFTQETDFAANSGLQLAGYALGGMA